MFREREKFLYLTLRREVEAAEDCYGFVGVYIGKIKFYFAKISKPNYQIMSNCQAKVVWISNRALYRLFLIEITCAPILEGSLPHIKAIAVAR